MDRFRAFAITIGLFLTVSANGLEPEEIEEFSRSIVQTIAVIKGKSVNGTGFFIDDVGHILTAGHNVLPPLTELGGNASPASDVKVRLYRPDAGENVDRSIEAVVIYADRQLDLALLRANVTSSSPLQLAPAGTLRDHATTGVLTWVADGLGGPGRPVHRSVTIDNVFNPKEYHDGLIDISGSDLGASSSGGPLLDEFSYVAGVFTKGRRTAGEAAVPIAFSSPMLHMAGVSYPSDAVREVITELQRDLVNWELDYEQSTGNVLFKFKKRLKAGDSPVRYFATFRIFTNKGRFAFEHKEELSQGPIVGKDGVVVFQRVGKQIDQEIGNRNDIAATQNPRGEKLGKKEYAEVTIVAMFADESRITGLIDYRMDFPR